MKFSILQENLLSSINIVKRAVSNKPQLPILSSLLIDVTETEIRILGTDLYLGIVAKALGTVETSGQAAVPAKIFYEVISQLNPGKVTVFTKDNALIVKSSLGTSQIQCLTADDFPPFPEPQAKNLSLPTDEFIEAVGQVLFAASRDETRPVLTSVLLALGEKTKVVATNGFRLAVREIESAQENRQLLIPARSLAEIISITKTAEFPTLELSVSEEMKQLFFYLGQTEVTVRLFDGEYPPYQKIVPTSFEFETEIETQELLHHLKAAHIFAKESSHIVELVFDQGKLLVKSTSSSLGKHESSLNVLTGDTKHSIAFNVTYLMDFLQNLKPEKVWFGMNDSLQPAMFKVAGRDNFFYVIMPFKLNQ